MKGAGDIRARAGAAAIAGLLGVGPALGAPPVADLIPARSGARVQAVAAISSTVTTPPTCLTPILQSLRSDRQRATPSLRRALATLNTDPLLPSERMVFDGDGVAARFTVDRNAFDRVETSDDNANGRPNAVDEALSAVARAQRLLVRQLELPNPGAIEIVMGRLGANVEGLSVPFSGRPARTLVWLDPAARGGAPAVRRAAVHQYAHAVAAAAGLDPAWGEAFANWTAIAVEGSPDDRALALVANRFASLAAGLVVEDLELASGNAAFFAFLDESYGPTTVKLAVEELGRGGSAHAALDRAIRRATGDTADAAFREFQMWSLLVGPRDDGRHFTFAGRLPGPAFAASVEALPALSVQADPEIAPMGSAAVLMRPGERSGGVTVRFEGELAARWGADLLLVRQDGELRRVPLSLDAEDAGELSVPLQDVREVLLLVRNLDAEGRPPRRYSWAAYFEPGYPTLFGALGAETAGPQGGALVSWETSSERGLLGFNVLRARSDRGEATRINPVWIPSLGESGAPASYSFFDATAKPGIAYRYSVEAVTLEGLASHSEAVALAPAP